MSNTWGTTGGVAPPGTGHITTTQGTVIHLNPASSAGSSWGQSTSAGTSTAYTLSGQITAQLQLPFTIQTVHGPILLAEDGSVKFPKAMSPDEVSRRIWERVGIEMAAHVDHLAMRATTLKMDERLSTLADKAREALPRLLPESVDLYDRLTLANRIIIELFAKRT